MTDSLEKILAYLNVKPFLSKDRWKELASLMSINTENLARRLKGKDIEASFFLIANSYDSVADIIVFDEGISKLTGTPSQGGIILMKSGDKFLIEVKSSDDKICTISSGRIQRQKALAKGLGLDLYFGIVLNGYYGLFTVDFIEGNGNKIEYPRDLRFSLFNKVFEPWFVKIPKGLRIIKSYSSFKSYNPLSELEHSSYGYLYNYQICFNDVIIHLDATQIMALTGIEVAILDNPKIHQLSETQQVITYECDKDKYRCDFDLMLSSIYLTVSSTTSDYFNSTSFVSQLLDSMSPEEYPLRLYQPKKNSEELLNRLITLGLPFELKQSAEIQDFMAEIIGDESQYT